MTRFQKQIIQLLNDRIFSCESNATTLRDMKITDPEIFTSIQESHNIYINLKNVIEVLIEEDKSRVG